MPAADPTKLSLFISSPGDVAAEREVVRRVIARVGAELSRAVTLEPYFSEDDVYFASRGPQEGIPLSSAFDLVVCLFWKRMGTRLLPEQFDAADGRKRTGSEFEFETAVAAARASPADARVPVPGVLVYRKTRSISYSADKVDEERAQHQALETFFERWIKDEEGHYLGYANRFASSEELARVFERHLRDWIAMQRRATDWDVATKGSPYRGLDVFEREHADVYFGRDRTILEGRARLKKAAESGFPVLWLVGASGSGKSSLLRAGLAPRLERSEGGLRSLIFRPSELGDDLSAGLATRLLDALPELKQGSFPDARALRDVLAVENAAPAVQAITIALTAWATVEARRCGWNDVPRTRLLIGIDQAEELLTQHSAAERHHLVGLLQTLLAADQIWLLLSFRSDFYALMQQDGELAPLKAKAQQLDIATPSAAELAEMIGGPARAAGLTLEGDNDGHALRDELCADASGTDSLPMLQFALRALHDKAIARGDHLLRLGDYDAMGRAAGALSSAAEASLQALPENVQAAFPRLLRELVDLNLQSSDRAPTAQNAPLSRFADDPAAQALIAALVEHRLLTQFDVSGETQARVVHESLFKHWPRAQQQIAEDARRLDVRRRLIDAHALWRGASDKRAKSSRLLTGPALKEGLDLAGAWALPDELCEFVRASQRADVRRHRKLWFAVIISALAAGLAVSMTWYASRLAKAVARAENAEEAARTMLQQAARKALGRAQQQVMAGNVTAQAAYLAESLKYVEIPDAGMPIAIALQQMDTNPLLWQIHHDGEIFTSQFSADGVWLLTASSEGLVRVTNVIAEDHRDVRFRADGDILSAQINADGSRVITRARDGLVRTWDARTGMELEAPLRHVSGIKDVQLSADGTRILSVSGAVQTWNALTGTPSGATIWHESRIRTAQFSADGNLVLTTSEDGTIRVWNTSTGFVRNVMSQLVDRSMSLQLSADGARVLSTSWQGTAQIWDASNSTLIGKPWDDGKSGRRATFSADGTKVLLVGWRNGVSVRDADSGELLEIPLHGNHINSAAFSADGERLVTVDANGLAKVWELRKGGVLGPSLWHEGNFSSAQFSPDGARLATISNGDTVSIWDMRAGAALGAPLRHEGWVRSARFSGDGSRVVTASDDSTARVWEAATGRPLLTLRTHEGWVLSAQLSPDGKKVLTTSLVNTAWVWDASSGAALAGPMRHQDWIRSAQFSPDGMRVVTASDDHTARIWDSNTGAELVAPLKHDGAVQSARFSADGERVTTASSDGAARIWSVADGSMQGAPLSHDDMVISAVFNADGSRVLTASADKTAQIWDARTRRAVGTPMQHQDRLSSVQFDATGLRVLTTSAGDVASIWDVMHRERPHRSLQHDGQYIWAEFSVKGDRVVTSNSDGTARMWDAGDGTALGAPLRHDNSVMSAHFREDGNRLVTASFDNTARVWDVRSSLPASTNATIAALESLGGQMAASDGSIVNVEAADILSWCRTIRAQTSTGTDFDRVIRWHLADRAIRTISPFSKLTIPEHIEREIDWALSHPQREPDKPQYSDKILGDAYNLNPAHPLILFALSVFEDRPETKALWKRLSFPRIAHDARLAARAAEILQQDHDPESAKKAAEIALSLEPDNTKAKAVLVWAQAELAKGSRR